MNVSASFISNLLEDVDPEELEVGIEDESEEHNISSASAEKIAMDHLKKYPSYYSQMKKIETSGMLTKKEGI